MADNDPHYDPVCTCNHREDEHGDGPCLVSWCKCPRYKFHHVEEHKRS